jgi:hypothetical protein
MAAGAMDPFNPLKTLLPGGYCGKYFNFPFPVGQSFLPIPGLHFQSASHLLFNANAFAGQVLVTVTSRLVDFYLSPSPGLAAQMVQL